MDVWVILLLIALGSLCFALLVLAKSPRSFGVRVNVALGIAVIGFAPLVVLVILIVLAAHGLAGE